MIDWVLAVQEWGDKHGHDRIARSILDVKFVPDAGTLVLIVSLTEINGDKWLVRETTLVPEAMKALRAMIDVTLEQTFNTGEG